MTMPADLPALPEVIAQLEAVLPEVEFGRGTHVTWRDWLRKDPENAKVNPHCGDADFHEKCIAEYDARLKAMRDAITCLRARAYAERCSRGEDVRDAARLAWLGDNACDVVMSASACDYGDGDKTMGPRVSLEPEQYPVHRIGSALNKLRAAIDAVMKENDDA